MHLLGQKQKEPNKSQLIQEQTRADYEALNCFLWRRTKHLYLEFRFIILNEEPNP